MSIDKAQLRALAEAASPSKWTTDGHKTVMSAESDQINAGYAIFESHGPDALKNAAFAAAANPATVLALLAEIDMVNAQRLMHLRLNVSMRARRKVWVSHCKKAEDQFLDVQQERDQLKAENESLRKDARRYRFLRNQHWPVAYLAVVVNPKVSVKLGYDCPSGDRLDEQVDGAMKREASHD
jgi:hypothetical protein